MYNRGQCTDVNVHLCRPYHRLDIVRPAFHTVPSSVHLFIIYEPVFLAPQDAWSDHPLQVLMQEMAVAGFVHGGGGGTVRPCLCRVLSFVHRRDGLRRAGT